MNCPLETEEGTGLLLDYCACKLSVESAAMVERHLAGCPACRDFAAGQQAVWTALDAWEAEPVSAGFDRRLYQRIETSLTWRGRVAGWLRPLLAYHGVPAAAVLGLLLAMAVVVAERPAPPAPVPASPEMAVVDVQPEQVEKALDTLDVLSEFNRKAKVENTESKL